jgi:hypothetical protein
MPKLRKMIGNDMTVPYLVSLMSLIETQSKETIARWCVSYAAENILPIFETEFPDDLRPRKALASAVDFLDGKVKLPEVKACINDCRQAAKDCGKNLIAEISARCIATVSSSVHTSTGSLSLALYGAMAIAYKDLGLDKTEAEYESYAAIECGKMEAALRTVAVENERNPAKINWNC